MKNFTKKDWLLLSMAGSLALFGVLYNEYVVKDDPMFHPVPLTEDEIRLYGNDQNAVVVSPILTQYAYSENGFYDYYKGKCGAECLAIKFESHETEHSFNMGANGYDYLDKLGYDFVTDIDIDQSPKILDKYDKIILLHNEYMTQNEFDAVKNHKNVIYLYPNAMFAKVDVDYNKGIMYLVRGHGFPNKNITNGFDYVTSSQFEYDTKCNNYKWQKTPNGIQPTCYPEYLLTYDHSIFQVIKDYPQEIPDLVTESDLHPLFCYQNGTCGEPPSGKFKEVPIKP